MGAVGGLSVGLAVLTAAVLMPGPASALGGTTYRWGAYWPNSAHPQHIQRAPRSVALSGVTAIAAGNSSDMALAGGNVYVWGDNTDGVLGLGEGVSYERDATEVPGLPTIVGIGETDNTDVAIDTTGAVWGWGEDVDGQLCQGNELEQWTPIRLRNLSDVTKTAGAGVHMMYLLGNGTLEECGGNDSGSLGDGSHTNSARPVTVTGLPSPIVQITASENDSGVVLADGEVWVWGGNKFGQLGNGVGRGSDVPVQVHLPAPAVDLSLGGGNGQIAAQALVLLADGTVWGWGSNQYGQLDDGTTTERGTPVEAAHMPGGVTQVWSGGQTSYVVDGSGTLWAWGDNSLGMVGNGSGYWEFLTPTRVMSGIQMVSATADDAMAYGP
ncbi:MAG TPA: hypothetical protein VN796_01410 [Acidimicrobiales bacterium]|nr:hypothetical protein [Acidimicrobiales bacterium]